MEEAWKIEVKAFDVIEVKVNRPLTMAEADQLRSDLSDAIDDSDEKYAEEDGEPEEDEDEVE